VTHGDGEHAVKKVEIALAARVPEVGALGVSDDDEVVGVVKADGGKEIAPVELEQELLIGNRHGASKRQVVSRQ
jgi:septum formation inhibitor-activating ATPase MinD